MNKGEQERRNTNGYYWFIIFLKIFLKILAKEKLLTERYKNYCRKDVDVSEFAKAIKIIVYIMFCPE